MDVRWKQRLDNFSRALEQLEKAVALTQERMLTDLEKQGIIQAFEFTHELAWNILIE
ncbi:MAG: nucleotidyltransferase substrate binding protein [Bacteriovoracaceae bacterium]|nr:nucleotidyltransferase substrate binding protein [Bacteriovoracaceae bacterium]